MLTGQHEQYMQIEHSNRLQSACDLLPKINCWSRVSEGDRLSSGEVSSIKVVYDHDPKDALRSAEKALHLKSKRSGQNKEVYNQSYEANSLLFQSHCMNSHAIDLVSSGISDVRVSSEPTQDNMHQKSRSSGHTCSRLQEGQLRCSVSPEREEDSLVIESCPIIVEDDELSVYCDAHERSVRNSSSQLVVDKVCFDHLNHSVELRSAIPA